MKYILDCEYYILHSLLFHRLLASKAMILALRGQFVQIFFPYYKLVYDTR